MQKNEAGTYQFDLKETVQLSHEQLPIEEIEDMELIPQVEVIEKGEEIDISGSLYLFGNYRGNLNAGKLEGIGEQPNNYEESVQFEPLMVERGPFSPLSKEDKFEYRIPIRINLPKGKVRDVSDVYPFISSFDYELKTPYQIEVMASLVITGFKEEEEEKVELPLFASQLEFVHVASENPVAPVTSEEEAIEQRLRTMEEQIAGLEVEQEEQVQAIAEVVNEDDGANEFVLEVSEEAYVNDQQEVEPEIEYAVEQEVQTSQFEVHDNVVTLPNLGQTEPINEAIEREEAEETEETVEAEETEAIEEIREPLEIEEPEVLEEPEVKVAISKKGNKQDREKITSLSSIFSRPLKEDPVVEDSMEESEEVSSANNEALYLTNFMGNKEENFVRMKLCIIQKDETIEDIADRYRVQVETILRANQATRNQVTAGQILYIPVKG